MFQENLSKVFIKSGKSLRKFLVVKIYNNNRALIKSIDGKSEMIWDVSDLEHVDTIYLRYM